MWKRQEQNFKKHLFYRISILPSIAEVKAHTLGSLETDTYTS